MEMPIVFTTENQRELLLPLPTLPFCCSTDPSDHQSMILSLGDACNAICSRCQEHSCVVWYIYYSPKAGLLILVAST